MKNREFNNVNINVEFTETPNRQQLTSGDNVNTLFGKIKKWLTDLKAVAFSGSYNDLEDKPKSLPASGGNADTVNEHTVESDVPSNAVFTDTVYDDTAIQNKIGDIDISSFGDTVTGAISSIGASTGVYLYKPYDLSELVTNDAYTGSGSPYFQVRTYIFGKLAILQFVFYNVTLSSSASVKVTFDNTEEFYTEVFSKFNQIQIVLSPYVNISGPPTGSYYSANGNFIFTTNKGTTSSNFILKTPDIAEERTPSYPITTFCIGYMND